MSFFQAVISCKICLSIPPKEPGLFFSFDNKYILKKYIGMSQGEGGKNNVHTLLLMDEFARFGKLEMFTNAISTLRSKSVNICLMVQSVAQFDKIYGEYDRRIIFDNCQYQAILCANDAETQKYISDLIGVQKDSLQGESEILDEFMENTGYSKQMNEIYKFTVFPHELSTLKDILSLTP